MTSGLSWLQIVRLGLVQSSLGAIVMLATTLLNRVMIVEIGLAAAVPAGLVAWHYVVQLSRPRWGHAADRGGKRTSWIIGGMAMLAAGAVLAAFATTMLGARSAISFALAILGYTLIGAGVGASGTSLLALLAATVAPARRAAAASLTWIMMIMGIIIAAGLASSWLEPFSMLRLLVVCCGVAGGAFVLTIAAVVGIEPSARSVSSEPGPRDAPPVRFGQAIAALWLDRPARTFTLFIFVAMMAYSMQDLILEPMAGLVFGYSPSQSTALAGVQHMGVLIGMIGVGAIGNRIGTARHAAMSSAMRAIIVGGCAASAAAIAGIAAGVMIGPGFALQPMVFALGFANGVFAVAAISAMMTLAGADGAGHEGIRIGLWGAAQAIGFGLGGFSGATGFDLAKSLTGSTADGFVIMFMIEALLFAIAAILATQIDRAPKPDLISNVMVTA